MEIPASVAISEAPARISPSTAAGSECGKPTMLSAERGARCSPADPGPGNLTPSGERSSVEMIVASTPKTHRNLWCVFRLLADLHGTLPTQTGSFLQSGVKTEASFCTPKGLYPKAQ